MLQEHLLLLQPIAAEIPAHWGVVYFSLKKSSKPLLTHSLGSSAWFELLLQRLGSFPDGWCFVSFTPKINTPLNPNWCGIVSHITLAGQPMSSGDLSVLPTAVMLNTWIQQYSNAGNLNSGPYACTASILPIEPFP